MRSYLPMQKLSTKSLIGSFLASAAILPLIASSVHGRTTTSISSQRSEGSDTILLAQTIVVFDQTGHTKQCTVSGNNGIFVKSFIKSCLYDKAFTAIDPSIHGVYLNRIPRYGNPQSPKYRGGIWEQAYRIITNKNYYRPKNTWAGYPDGPAPGKVNR